MNKVCVYTCANNKFKLKKELDSKSIITSVVYDK